MLRRSLLINNKPKAKPFWVIFDDNKSSTALEIGGDSNARNTFFNKFRRCIATPKDDGSVRILYLDNNDSSKLENGSSYSSNYIMSYFPKFYYKNENLGNKRWKLIVAETPFDGCKEERSVLVGAFEASETNGKLTSKPNVNSAVGMDILTFFNKALQNGKDWGIIDYRVHKIIANMFCLKYGNTNISTRNSSIPCSGGTRAFNESLGNTMSLGNKDGLSGKSSSFLGLEDCYSGCEEVTQGLNIINNKWVSYEGGLRMNADESQLISEGYQNVRVIGIAKNNNGWIKEINHGEYADVMPTEIGGNENTYYSDWYDQGGGNKVFIRAGESGFGPKYGVFCSVCNYDQRQSFNVSTRLCFYGDVKEEQVYSVKEAPNGVYILGIDNLLYVKELWNKPNSDAVGVAVVANEAKFVVAANQLSKKWGKTGNTIAGVVITTNKNEALKDFKGKENTSKIINGDDQSEAAYYCANYAFKNGEKGYLAALGEWQIAYNNKTEIDACIAKIDGENMGSVYYWSSTQFLSGDAWAFRWNDAHKRDYVKTTYQIVRPFSVLIEGIEPPKPIVKNEIVNINLTSSDISKSIIGTTFNVVYEGFNENYTWQGSTISLTIPENKNVVVTYNSLTDFIIPQKDEFTTVAGNTRVLNKEYTYNGGSFTNGVYILGTDNKLYKENEWTQSNDNAVGVAVITNKAKFVIAPDRKFDVWGDPYRDVPGVLNAVTNEEGFKDLDGRGNTEKIATDYDSAAYLCKRYSFKNGKSGYLPSMGEAKIAFDNKTEIDILFNKIGWDMPTGTMWTSTEGYSTQYACTYNWGYGGFSTSSANKGYTQTFMIFSELP